MFNNDKFICGVLKTPSGDQRHHDPDLGRITVTSDLCVITSTWARSAQL